MGRLLLTATLFALLAVGPAAAQERPAGPADSERPHAELTCAACHRGGDVGGRPAGVPEASCTASGCHEDAGPERVGLTTVDFPHRDHGEKADVSLGCAGCHTHDAGEDPLRASVDACALCHAAEMGGRDPRGCRSCHQDPDFVPVTGQGVPVPHQGLPWLETGCVRCHYDVAEPRVEVSLTRCRDCHDNVREVVAGGAGADLHPEHAQFNCTSCHQAGAHRIVRMSSSVRLECGSCHRRSHGAELAAPGAPGGAVCAACHEGVHREEQQLVLGMVPGSRVLPAYKFLSGMTCESCHVPGPEDDPAAAVGAPAAVCADCHRSEYRDVVRRWTRGAEDRAARVRGYRGRAQRALDRTAGDSVAELLARSGELLETASAGGVWHNPPLVDRMHRDALELVRRAYRSAGRTAPPPPELGTPARVGQCSYCHYGPDDPGPVQRMSDEFHRDVMEEASGEG